MNSHEALLGQEKIAPLLWKLSFPAMTGMLVMSLYNVADAFFIGQGVGSHAVGGIAVVFPAQMLMMAVSQTLGIGGASLVSRLLGAGNHEKAEEAFGNVLFLGVISGLALSVLGLIFMNPVLRIFGATEKNFIYAADYLRVILFGAVLAVLGMAANNLARSEGKAAVAMRTMLISAAVNTGLDALFIFVFGWGIEGAAWATVISQGSSTLYLTFYFLSGKSALRPRWRYFRIHLPVASKIFSVGLSAFFRQFSSALMTGILNHQLFLYGGDSALSVFGILFRLQMFILMPLFGIVQGLQPIVGFNYGAGRVGRVKKTLELSILWATGLAVAGFLLLFFFPEVILRVFTSDTRLIQEGIPALKNLILFLPLVGFQVVGSGMYQALGKAVPAFLLSILRQILFFIPLSFLLPLRFGIQGVWAAFPAADLLAFFVTLSMVFFEWRKLRRQRREYVSL